MKNKAPAVFCTFSDSGQTLAELLVEVFQVFLQKELFSPAIPPSMRQRQGDE